MRYKSFLDELWASMVSVAKEAVLSVLYHLVKQQLLCCKLTLCSNISTNYRGVTHITCNLFSCSQSALDLGKELQYGTKYQVGLGVRKTAVGVDYV